MEQDNSTDKLGTLASRRKRINRIKITIILLVVLFLILPTIICVIMFFKVNSLQKQIDVLMIEHYGVTYTELNKKNHQSVAHAAVVNKSKVSNNDEQTSIEERKDSDATNQKKDALNNTQNDKNSSNDNSAGTEVFSNESVYDLNFTINKEAMKSKKVYLTFDDGPSKYTGDILDILAEYNVKATFFVIGKTDDFSKSMYKRIVDEGHSIGIHSYSHVYDNIYNSLENFDKDFTKLSDLLYDTTGYIPNIYRFPGGSGNNVSNVKISNIVKYLNNNNIVYFDWNVENGDATGNLLTPKELYYNVIKGVNIHNTSIVLMHDTDTKENTVKSLKYVLKTLTDLQAEILPLNKSVTPIQQVEAGQYINK